MLSRLAELKKKIIVANFNQQKPADNIINEYYRLIIEAKNKGIDTTPFQLRVNPDNAGSTQTPQQVPTYDDYKIVVINNNTEKEMKTGGAAKKKATKPKPKATKPKPKPKTTKK